MAVERFTRYAELLSVKASRGRVARLLAVDPTSLLPGQVPVDHDEEPW